MTLTSATFYDDNGVVRLQGQLDAGGGSQPSVQVYGPYTVAFNQPGASVVLWNAKAGDLILDLFVIPTVTWTTGAGLDIYTDAYDFVRPGRAGIDGALTATSDTTRFVIPQPAGAFAENKAYFGGNDNLTIGAYSTPSLMKIDADVICDILGSPIAGVAKIWALVFPA